MLCQKSETLASGRHGAGSFRVGEIRRNCLRFCCAPGADGCKQPTYPVGLEPLPPLLRVPVAGLRLPAGASLPPRAAHHPAGVGSSRACRVAAPRPTARLRAPRTQPGGGRRVPQRPLLAPRRTASTASLQSGLSRAECGTTSIARTLGVAAIATRILAQTPERRLSRGGTPSSSTISIAVTTTLLDVRSDATMVRLVVAFVARTNDSAEPILSHAKRRLH